MAKILLFGFVMITIAFCGLASGVLFGAYILGLSRNPLEKDNLFSQSMTAFIFIETFVFMGLLIAVAVSLVF